VKERTVTGTDAEQVLMHRPSVGIYSLRLQGSPPDRESKAVVEIPGEMASGASFSPDGRWIVYVVRGTRIYVQPFPGLPTQIANVQGNAILAQG
jgi:hypothetical protein